jgi:hypothetical protein
MPDWIVLQARAQLSDDERRAALGAAECLRNLLASEILGNPHKDDTTVFGKGRPAKLMVRETEHSDAKVANHNFKVTGRQRMSLERRTHPTLSRRTSACVNGLQSCRGKSAGVAKRHRERSSTRNPTRYDSQLLHRCVEETR